MAMRFQFHRQFVLETQTGIHTRRKIHRAQRGVAARVKTRFKVGLFLRRLRDRMDEPVAAADAVALVQLFE